MTIYTIDIETLDTAPTAKILEIAVIQKATEKNPAEYFYRVIDPRSQRDRTISYETMVFWMNQGDQLKELVEKGETNGFSLESSLRSLHSYFIRQCLKDEDIIFTQGLFDHIILEHAFRQYEIPIPWMYFNIKDLRTFMWSQDLKKSDIKIKNKKEHSALEDARFQMACIKKALRRRNLCLKKI